MLILGVALGKMAVLVIVIIVTVVASKLSFVSFAQGGLRGILSVQVCSKVSDTVCFNHRTPTHMHMQPHKCWLTVVTCFALLSNVCSVVGRETEQRFCAGASNSLGTLSAVLDRLSVHLCAHQLPACVPGFTLPP